MPKPGFIGASPVLDNEDKGIWSHKQVDPEWDETNGKQQRFTAFSNAEEVELFVSEKF